MVTDRSKHEKKFFKIRRQYITNVISFRGQQILTSPPIDRKLFIILSGRARLYVKIIALYWDCTIVLMIVFLSLSPCVARKHAKVHEWSLSSHHHILESKNVLLVVHMFSRRLQHSYNCVLGAVNVNTGRRAQSIHSLTLSPTGSITACDSQVFGALQAWNEKRFVACVAILH